MTAVFRADRKRRATAVFEPVEATLLRGLVGQLVELVEDGGPGPTAPVQDWAAELGLQDVGLPGPTAPPEDAVLRRLLPDGYSPDGEGDPEAAAEHAAEFRRLTENGLRRTKSSRARLVLDSLGRPESDPTGQDTEDPVTVRLEPAPAQAWLTVLTDLRLALAIRLGIQTEEDAAALDALAQTALARTRRRQRRVRGGAAGDARAGATPDDPRIGVYQVYSWLGYLQESLVQSLS